ncbi:MAG: hypothetical protein IJ093_04690 [Bacilli bacterium]|nr:hypothetical protein [Bacilli bacterium]
MEKNKNILIGGLLAVVLVMAVGYAAFATQLTINGKAEINSSWNVHFDTTKTESENGVVVGTPGTLADGTTLASAAPTGTVTYPNNLKAELNAKLTQPGDKVVFTLTILNEGTLNAIVDSGPTLTLAGGDVQGLTATKGHIKFEVTSPNPTAIAANDGSATMTVTATFIDTDTAAGTTGNYTSSESATLTVDLSYKQNTGA